MTSAFAAIALAGTLACAGALVVLHLLPTGYKPLEDAVSDYGVGRFRLWYRAQTTANAIAAVALAVALGAALKPEPRRVIVLLVVFAIARFLIPWFPTDLRGTGPTPTGRRHALLAGVAFLTIALAAGSLPGHDHGSGLRALGVIVIAAAIATAVAVRLTRWFGAVERLFYLSMLTWLVVAAVELI
ncbi:MAG TPA: DUF998 domain-containing protein [Gaiellaceae bacterium]